MMKSALRPNLASAVDSSSPQEQPSDPRFAAVDRTVPGPAPGDVDRHVPNWEFAVEVITDANELVDHVPDWRDLLKHAVEPNVFYGPDFLRPALEHLPIPKDQLFLVVKGTDRRAAPIKPVWCGFFPWVRRRRFRGLPVRNLSFLTHDYCFLRTPLVREETSAEVMSVVFDWLAKESQVAVSEWADQRGDGHVHRHLIDRSFSASQKPWVASAHHRAILYRSSDPEEAIRSALAGRKIKEMRRLERRLAEEAPVRYESLSPSDDPSPWIEEFLELERSGWKGRQGTAMASQPESAAFFRAMATSLFEQGQLRIQSLRVGDRPIAMLCNLLAPPGSYSFKIAFSEDHARYSPGVLLEMDNVRRFHLERNLEWMDSCADPNHSMINHIWRDRRPIQTLVVPTGRPLGSAVTTLASVLSFAKRATFRKS